MKITIYSWSTRPSVVDRLGRCSSGWRGPCAGAAGSMAGAGAGLVAASPAGPVQAVPDPFGVGRLGLQDDDEAADLVGGETQGRDGAGGVRLVPLCGRRTAPPPDGSAPRRGGRARAGPPRPGRQGTRRPAGPG